MAPRTVMLVFGTRPEAIKMAPVLREIGRHADLSARVVVSAQHRQMLDSVLELFDIHPHHDLDLMRPDQDLFDVTARALVGLRDVIAREKPELILVQGDTTTAFVGALAGYYSRVSVGHVEAGLRTRNKYNPYPEELNRQMASVLSDVHFAPTAGARQHLIDEAVPADRIVVTGNTVVDALLDVASRPLEEHPPELAGVDPARSLLLVTAHRRESFGRPLQQMLTALRLTAEAFPDVEIVYPVHMNPNVQRQAAEVLAGVPRVHLIAPLAYDRFVQVMRRAHLILTDSGGIQEEAPSLGKPVLVMRETTERPEGLEAGTVRLVGTDADSIQRGVARLLNDPEDYRAMANARNPYGDGRAAERIVRWIRERFAASRQAAS
jgi:UDP-N-acetylglucosamine 2-epimerase (non-hydrolysing)